MKSNLSNSSSTVSSISTKGKRVPIHSRNVYDYHVEAVCYDWDALSDQGIDMRNVLTFMVKTAKQLGKDRKTVEGSAYREHQFSRQQVQGAGEGRSEVHLLFHFWRAEVAQEFMGRFEAVWRERIAALDYAGCRRPKPQPLQLDVVVNPF